MEFLGQKASRSYYHFVDSRFPLSPFTLPDQLDLILSRQSDSKVTWYRPHKTLTHRQIIELAQRYAKGLLACGVTKGDTICAFGSDTYEASVLFIACCYLGVKFTSPYLWAPVQRSIADFIDTLKPVMVFSGLTRTGMFDDKNYTECASLIETRAADNHQFQVKYFFHDEEVEQQMNSSVSSLPSEPLSYLLSLAENVSDEEFNKAKSYPQMNEPCLYITSSGSTGGPKHILLGAAHFANTGARVIERLGLTQEDTIAAVSLTTIEMAHLDFFMASLTGGFNLLVYPHTTDLASEADYIAELLKATEEYKPKFAHIDQWYTHYLVTRPSCREGYDISSLKGLLITAGSYSEGYKKQVAKQYPLSYDWYGLTEFNVICSLRPGELGSRQNAGRPFCNVEVKIADELGQPVPFGEKGEIQARGYACFLEYHKQPELTKNTKTSDGWFKTGDCGIMDEEGYIRIVGRITENDRIKLAGDVVYLAPIENVLKDHPKIKECCVVGIPLSGDNGDESVYCIVVKPGEQLTAEEVKSYAQERMQQLEWPWRVMFFEELHKIGSRKKISRKHMKEECIKRVKTNRFDGLIEYFENLTKLSIFSDEQHTVEN